mmetsp:Transcript_7887/g.16929  ORF Transcript_7887/g.16929 Transcript_7887/m.16929 type:complete len:206 (-) Transcript_7887:1621-2238(-)
MLPREKPRPNPKTLQLPLPIPISIQPPLMPRIAHCQWSRLLPRTKIVGSERPMTPIFRKAAKTKRDTSTRNQQRELLQSRQRLPQALLELLTLRVRVLQFQRQLRESTQNLPPGLNLAWSKDAKNSVPRAGTASATSRTRQPRSVPEHQNMNEESASSMAASVSVPRESIAIVTTRTLMLPSEISRINQPIARKSVASKTATVSK